MGVAAARATPATLPRFGLRFDRGRAQLVLGEPLDAGPLRVEALVMELAALKGRVPLAEGWRAFRHRRTTLVEARVSISLESIARLVADALGGAEVSAIGSASGASLAVRSATWSLVAELACGSDGEDLLLVVEGARAFPRGPRGALALAHDLASSIAPFDEARGALRVAAPVRRALLEALLPAGVRAPSTRGIACAASVEAGRVVL